MLFHWSGEWPSSDPHTVDRGSCVVYTPISLAIANNVLLISQKLSVCPYESQAICDSSWRTTNMMAFSSRDPFKHTLTVSFPVLTAGASPCSSNSWINPSHLVLSLSPMGVPRSDGWAATRRALCDNRRKRDPWI
jgi:hypothetical protein